MKNIDGFTIIELIIILVIVSVLAIIAVPSFKGYMIKAYAAEGKALVLSIAAAEKRYYIGHNIFYATPSGFVNNDATLGIDSRANRYFTTFGAGSSGALGVPGYAQDNQGYKAWSNAAMSTDAMGLYVEVDGDYQHNTALVGVKYKNNWIQKDW